MKTIAQHQDYSEKTAVDIDEEVKRMVTESYSEAKKLIEENEKKLYELADALLEKEVLDGSEIDEIIFGKAKKVRKRKSGIDKEKPDKELKKEVEPKDKAEPDKKRPRREVEPKGGVEPTGETQS